MSILEINQLNKTYSNGFVALKNIDLTINKGEIFALLGPNGAGKTTLISAVCGIVNASSGSILVGGHDNVKNYRDARRMIGLVPQELTTDAFITVWDTIKFSQRLFGADYDPEYLEQILKNLSLWDKKNNQIRTLSGGMKRRVLIAKALSHKPDILFLDEPTAGVDVDLRKDMWDQMRVLRESGVTIILTTHYIEEAEDMADRVGVINGGEIILVEDKKSLMKKMGRKQLTVELKEPLDQLPSGLTDYDVQVQDGTLTYTYDSLREEFGVDDFLCTLHDAGLKYKDVQTRQSSLEEIFVELVKR
ncbi:MAG: multidrug ABC transporter ATP-binding protein [Bdellovibrionaceae bacterium]|nr:multidrug ABC transporter ATP-binding protein [Pseudobdellovibrionaceae bacterium]